MDIVQYKSKIPEEIYSIFIKRGFKTLRPSQKKAIDAGIFEKKSLLICTPTASGKTAVAEFALLQAVLIDKVKAVYIVPLKALASEKYREFKERYEGILKVSMSVGDFDDDARQLAQSNIIITTSEKCDALIRNKSQWMQEVKCLVVDEIHLINDVSRGPTLEILLTIFRMMQPKLHLIGLSATIGNPKDLAKWLECTLVEDSWRPVALKQGTYLDGEVKFYE